MCRSACQSPSPPHPKRNIGEGLENGGHLEINELNFTWQVLNLAAGQSPECKLWGLVNLLESVAVAGCQANCMQHNQCKTANERTTIQSPHATTVLPFTRSMRTGPSRQYDFM